jgi:hypothetical protein
LVVPSGYPFFEPGRPGRITIDFGGDPSDAPLGVVRVPLQLARRAR